MAPVIHLAVIALAALAPLATAAPAPFSPFGKQDAKAAQAAQSVRLPAYWTPAPLANWTVTAQPASLSSSKNRLPDMFASFVAVSQDIGMSHKNTFSDAKTGVVHHFVVQTIGGIEVANTAASLAVDKSGNIVSRSSSWLKGPTVDKLVKDLAPGSGKTASGTGKALHLHRRGLPAVTPADAVAALADKLGIPVKASSLVVSPDPDAPANSDRVVVSGLPDGLASGTVTAQTKLYATPDGIRLTWDISMPRVNSWINAFVGQDTPTIHGVADWSSSLARDGDHILVPRGKFESDTGAGAAARKGAGAKAGKVAGANGRSGAGKVAGANKRAGVGANKRAGAAKGAGAKKRAGAAKGAGAKKRAGAAKGAGAKKRAGAAKGAGAGAGAGAGTGNRNGTGNDNGAGAGNDTGAGAGNNAVPNQAYRVIPFEGRDPSQSEPVLITNPFDKEASPLGWHDTGDSGKIDQTAGNNVFANENRRNRADILSGLSPVSPDLAFDFNLDDSRLEPPQYSDASITQAFFVANAFHDTLYKYGFTEEAGNFQVNNFGKGGAGRDPVIALVQDGSGTNNANFLTPPDGQPGIMRMFIFTTARPSRDGSLDNSVVIHELAHGLSNRLTGGPANANCLQQVQSGGMGEGWSDIVAVMLEMNADDTRNDNKVVGTYATNSPRGVRQFPMSTRLADNPLRYSVLQNEQQVHNVGEIWSVMLFEAYWNVVDELGFEPNMKDNAASGKGNTLFMQLVVDGMKLQPCNPTFVQARDAIIKADEINNGGSNRCSLFKGFAKRGMGANVVDNGRFADNFDLPDGC